MFLQSNSYLLVELPKLVY